MHSLITSVMEILLQTGNPTAVFITDKLGALQDHEFTAQFPPVPHLKHLKTASETPDAHPFTHDIYALENHLPWQVFSGDVASDEIVNGSTFCHIVGPDGLIEDETFRMGFYLQAPELFYRSHSHNAEEVYYVLSGTALWQKDSAPFTLHKPGTLIHHPPNQPHTMHTQKDPLLALWAWVGDIGFESYRFH